ncbi:MAG TPA: GT4 family glycosyltransferase PelF [Candidatus Nitrosotalea sp.]|nr:GT4 family glycosyltransferase PelF [Candidatus Nitrosotalea sp.]
MINWDNYPNIASGGVYTWEKTLIDHMADYEFIILNHLSNPNNNSEYVLPKNVTQVIEVPIYGSIRYEEYCHHDISLISRILRTTERVIREKFMPLYKDFVASMVSDHCNTASLADTIVNLHNFLLKYDGKKCLEHPMAWNVFIEELNKVPLYRNILIKEAALMMYQTFQRSIQLLATKIPKVDIIHCSLAWFPTLVAVYAKRENNCPVLITEHGIAFREISLFYNQFMYDEPSKIFAKIVSRNLVQLIYSITDSLTPVCQVNKNWEKKLGVDPSKIKVIYNAINTSKFKPIQVEHKDKRPTIVSVARVVGYKDIPCLVYAVKYAKQQIPDLQCLIYGTAPELDYSKRCVKLVKELKLEDNIKFMGGTSEPEKAYNLGDAVVMTSITEGFPFSIIEAMACGKAVIASDVGGDREALQGCGILVRSRRPLLLAQAIVRVLQDDKLRHQLEQAALKKVQDDFTLEQCGEHYKKEYEILLRSYEDRKLMAPAEIVA